MRRNRREKDAAKIKLRQPDRSTPTAETLIQLAEEQGLFEKAERQREENQNAEKPTEPEEKGDGPGLSPTAERIMDTILWSVSLAMLHVTLDVLVQNQYAVEISWPMVAIRAGQALAGKHTFSGLGDLVICYPCLC
jgi:hypothetical protein